MAISLVGGALLPGQSGNGNDVVITLPGTIAQDDYVVVCNPFTRSGSAVDPVPSGYSEIANVTDATNDIELSISIKKMGASPDSSVTVPGTGVGVDGHPVMVGVLRGVDTTTPEDATATTASAGSGNPDGPSITTVTDGAWVLTLGMHRHTAALTSSPSGYSNSQVAQEVDTRRCTAFGATKEVTTAGAEDPGAWVFSNSSVAWAAATVAFRPASGGPTIKSASDTVSVGATDAVSAILSLLARTDDASVGVSDSASKSVLPFSPDQITGLKLWLDANAITGLVDGDPVATWADGSGGGRDVTAAGTARPTYKTNIQNGKPIVRFDGGTDVMTRADALGFTGNPGMTIFAVTKFTHASQTNKIFFQTGDESTAGAFIAARSGANGQSVNFGNGNEEYGTASYDVFAVNVWKRPASGNIGATVFYQNGSEVSHSAQTNPTNSPTLTDTKTSVGGGAQGGANFWTGDIAEIVVYDSALSDEQRAAVETYLTEKWISSTVAKSGSDTLSAGATDAVSGVLALLDRMDTLSAGATDAVSALLSLLARTDTLSAGASEGTTALLSILARTDTLSVSAVEGTVALLVALSRSDTASVSAGESVGAIVAGLTASDSASVAISESALILSILARTDALTVDAVGAAAITVALAASDAAGVSLADAVAGVMAGLVAADTVNVDAIGTAVVLGLLARTDTLGASVVEAAVTAVLIATSDTTTVSVAEARTILAALNRTDALAVAIADSVAELLGVVARSDTLDVAALDTVASLVAILAATDTITVAAADAVATIVNALTRADTLDVGAVEALVSLVSLLARVDTADLSLGELASIFGTVSATDTLAITAADVALAAITLLRSDTAAVGVLEGTPDIVGAIAGADTLAVTLSEARTILGLLARSEALGVALGESVDVLVSIAGADMLDLGVVDAASVGVLIETADVAGVAVVEAIDLLGVLSRADTLDLVVADASAIAAVLAASDTLAVVIVDEAGVVGAIVGQLAIMGIKVEPALRARIEALAAIGVDRIEAKPAIGGRVRTDLTENETGA